MIKDEHLRDMKYTAHDLEVTGSDSSRVEIGVWIDIHDTKLKKNTFNESITFARNVAFSLYFKSSWNSL